MNNSRFSIPESLLATQSTRFSRNSSGLNTTQTQLLRQLAHDALMETRLSPPEDVSGNATGFSVSAVAHAILLACFIMGFAWKNKPTEPLQATLFTELPGREPAPKSTSNPINKPVTSPAVAKPATLAKPTQKPEPTPKTAPKKADLELDKSKKKSEPKDKAESKKPDPKPETKTEPKPAPQTPKTDILEKLRQEEIARAKSSSPSTNTTNNQTSPGRNQPGYSDKIRQFVRSRLVFPGADSLLGNPQAVFEVRQMPTGEIISITMKQSSGNFAWDEAIQRALDRSSPLPRADDGSVEPVLLLSFRPKDMQ